MVRVFLFVFVVAFFCQANAQVKPIDKKLVVAMKDEALQHVQGNAKKVQEMVDMVFSFGELGDIGLSHQDLIREWIYH
jgi:uncharacterized membrane protein